MSVVPHAWSRVPAGGALALLGLLAVACDHSTIGSARADAAVDAAPLPEDAGHDAAVAPADTAVTVDAAPAAPDAAFDALALADAPQADVAADALARPDAIWPPGPAPAVAVFTAYANSCAVFASGALKCWGDNASGQLGLGDRVARGDKPGTMGSHLPIVDLGVGRFVRTATVGLAHACALLDDHRVKCWGSNSHGQLGAGQLGDNLGDDPDEMGDRLPAVDLGTGRTALAIAAGPRQTCALLDDHHVKCWGNDVYGSLGQGGAAERYAPNLGDLLMPVDLGTGVTAAGVSAGGGAGMVSCYNGGAYVCALTDSGLVKCWGGCSPYDALGVPNVRQRGDRREDMGDNLTPVILGGHLARAVAMGNGHGCALLESGDVKCWGNDHQSQLGAGMTPGTPHDPYPSVNLGTGRTATAIAVTVVGGLDDLSHSCALLDDGTLKCWGSNLVGQLGQGDLNGRGWFMTGDAIHPIDLGGGRRVLSVAAGYQHTCAVIEGGAVKCWGKADRGVLGLEDAVDRGGKPGDMGDHLPALTLC
jgi:hypothetical protein